MPRRKFSSVEPSYCRVLLVKEAPAPMAPSTGPAAIADQVRPLAAGLPYEAIWVVALDARRRPVAIVQVSQGTLTQTMTHPREVFRVAFLANAAAIALVHNHPSGDPQPSPEDHALTKRLRAAGELMAVPLLDHIILGEGDRFFSYQTQGWP